MDTANNESVAAEQELIDDSTNDVVKNEKVPTSEEVKDMAEEVETNVNSGDVGSVDAEAAENKSNENDDSLKKDTETMESVENCTNEEVASQKVESNGGVPEESQSVDVTMEEQNSTTVESKESHSCQVENENKDANNETNVDIINKDFIENTNENASENVEDLFFEDKHTPLQIIAMQYDSSDEETNDKDKDSAKKKSIDVSNAQDYRNQDEVVLSSDSESDSESDSSSSSSDSDSSVKVSSANSEDSSDETNKKKNTRRKNNKNNENHLKNECDDLPPIEDLQISVPEVLCDPVGKVAWFVNQIVVVRPEPGKPTLNLDTVLFIEKGQRALGHIFDVFGQVAEPHYCVRFNSSEHIQERDIKVGMTVYFCPNTPYTSLVFLSELQKMKPIDDLGEDDPPQFSDDEEERAYLASVQKKSNKANQTQQEGQGQGGPKKRRRVNNNKQDWQSHHPWNSYRENQQLQQQMATRPFYRSHHPWSRPRYPQVNNQLWYQQEQPQQQYMPYQQANWAYPQAQQAYPYYNAQQQQQQPYQQVDPNYAQVQQQPQVNNAQMQQQPQADGAQLQNFASQYPLILPPPPPPPSDQNK